EIFANIEQVTLFVTEPTSEAKSSVAGQYVSPVLPSVGIAVRSHNPAQTKELLGDLLTVLGVANMAVSGFSNPEAGENEDRYMIGAFDEKTIYCYLRQSGRNTILSLSAETAEACVKAVESGQNVLSDGPLQAKLAGMGPNASKLILANHGGVIRLLNAHIHKGLDESGPLPYSDLLEQLAQVFDKTSLEVATGETENSFKVRASLSNLPPGSEIFPIAMQLAEGVPKNLTTQAVEPNPADGAKISPEAKVVLEWEQGAKAESHKVYFGTSRENLELAGETEEIEFEEPRKLEEGSAYYWRVDEITEDGNVTEGEVWNFGTGQMVFNKKSEDSWLTGGEGKGLEFDGVDDFIDIEIDESMEQMTIAMWLKFNEIRSWENEYGQSEKFSSLISSDDYWSTGAVHFNLNGHDVDPPILEFNVIGTADMDFSSQGGLESGKWYHVIVVYDDLGDEVRIYINGQLDTEAGMTVGPVIIGKAAIGMWRDNGRFFDGVMDDIRIYNYAMDEEEAAGLYVSPYASKPEPADGSRTAPTGPKKFQWKAGIGSVGHKLYFGNDPEELSLLAELEVDTYSELPDFEENTSYYWRVNEVQRDGSVIEGNIWRFNTGGLVAHWTFDEGQGRTAKDSAGTYDGIMHGWVGWFNDGKIGGAIALDSEDGYVEVEHIGTFDAVTLAMWIKVYSLDNTWTSILHNDGWNSNDVHYHLIRDGHFRIALNGSRAKSVGEYNEYDPKPLPADQDSRFAFTKDKFGQWHHIAIVYDSQAKIADFYVDGQLDVRRNYEEVVPAKLGPLRIGSYDTSSREFNGTMDDIRIYDYALSENDVADLYSEGAD
ncbi:MAG: LamG domain-containing protein, partial [Planctomycetota bacterium]